MYPNSRELFLHLTATPRENALDIVRRSIMMPSSVTSPTSDCNSCCMLSPLYPKSILLWKVSRLLNAERGYGESRVVHGRDRRRWRGRLPWPIG
jgi:hypothetical protein